MADDKKKEKKEEKVVHELHLDDFLNEQEAEHGHIESLQAFGSQMRRDGKVKDERSNWKRAYTNFMNDIPQ